MEILTNSDDKQPDLVSVVINRHVNKDLSERNKCDLHGFLLDYCYECERKICQNCEKFHGGHMTVSLKDESDRIRTKLKEEVYKLKHLIRYSCIVTYDLQHYIDRMNASLANIMEEILKRSEYLQKDDVVIVDVMIKDIQFEHDQAEAILVDKISEFNEFVSSAKHFYVETERVINSSDDEIIIQQHQHILTSVLQQELTLPLCLSERPIYILTPMPDINTGKDNLPLEILGEFSKEFVPWRIEVKRINSFRPECIGARCVTTMCQGWDEHVWVVWQWGPLLHLLDKNGDIKKKVDLGCKVDGVCTVKDGLAISCHIDRCIKVLNDQCDVIKTFQLVRIPRGIYTNCTGEIIVCCVENMHRRKDDVSVIKKLDITSGQLTVLPCSEDLVQPCRVAVNVNDDICVSDRNKGSVMIFNQEGKIKSTYRGPGSSTRHLFAPESVRCDKYGQVLVVDYTNHTVHVLDPLGRFRGFLIMDTELEKRAIFMGTSSPFSITIDSAGDLWVGNKFGFLTVLKYLS